MVQTSIEVIADGSWISDGSWIKVLGFLKSEQSLFYAFSALHDCQFTARGMYDGEISIIVSDQLLKSKAKKMFVRQWQNSHEPVMLWGIVSRAQNGIVLMRIMWATPDCIKNHYTRVRWMIKLMVKDDDALKKYDEFHKQNVKRARNKPRHLC